MSAYVRFARNAPPPIIGVNRAPTQAAGQPTGVMTMAEPTKAELLEENAALRARVDELESGATPAQVRQPPRPPSFGTSEGVRNDIEQAKHLIDTDPKVTEVPVSDPGTGAVMTVTADSGDEFEPDEQHDRELTKLDPHPDRIAGPDEQQ